ADRDAADASAITAALDLQDSRSLSSSRVIWRGSRPVGRPRGGDRPGFEFAPLRFSKPALFARAARGPSVGFPHGVTWSILVRHSAAVSALTRVLSPIPLSRGPRPSLTSLVEMANLAFSEKR